jgi:hypothetical protein
MMEEVTSLMKFVVPTAIFFTELSKKYEVLILYGWLLVVHDRGELEA